jgi:cysteine synthase A
MLPPAEPAVIADPAERVVDSWTRCATVRRPDAASL